MSASKEERERNDDTVGERKTITMLSYNAVSEGEREKENDLNNQ
jgi:hypothetical protein